MGSGRGFFGLKIADGNIFMLHSSYGDTDRCSERDEGGRDMVFSIRKWTSRLLFIVIFFLLLLAFTGSYRWMVDVISPLEPYRKPKGEAVKVFTISESTPDRLNISERLRWFYWYGE